MCQRTPQGEHENMVLRSQVRSQSWGQRGKQEMKNLQGDLTCLFYFGLGGGREDVAVDLGSVVTEGGP